MYIFIITANLIEMNDLNAQCSVIQKWKALIVSISLNYGTNMELSFYNVYSFLVKF